MMPKNKYLILTPFFLVAFFITIYLIPFNSEYKSDGVVDVSSIRISDYSLLSRGRQNEVFFTKYGDQRQVYYGIKPITSVALSPSKRQTAFFYFPDDKTREKISLVIYDFQKKTFTEIYHTSHASWDFTGALNWLGNNYLFFMRHCGTACKGITLLSMESGQETNAVLSYPSFLNQPAKTHFKDWFGREFNFDGLVVKVNSETKGKNNYLVFTLADTDGNNLGEKRLFYTENSLKLAKLAKMDKNPSEIHEKKNQELKEWSIKYSPDGKKAAYYQNKFVSDIRDIGDPDYTSLVVERGGRTDIVFRGNFHLSHFEWLDNDKIKIYKGCGSSCLLSYVVNINTKQFKESFKKILLL